MWCTILANEPFFPRSRKSKTNNNNDDKTKKNNDELAINPVLTALVESYMTKNSDIMRMLVSYKSTEGIWIPLEARLQVFWIQYFC